MQVVRGESEKRLRDGSYRQTPIIYHIPQRFLARLLPRIVSALHRSQPEIR